MKKAPRTATNGRGAATSSRNPNRGPPRPTGPPGAAGRSCRVPTLTPARPPRSSAAPCRRTGRPTAPSSSGSIASGEQLRRAAAPSEFRPREPRSERRAKGRGRASGTARTSGGERPERRASRRRSAPRSEEEEEALTTQVLRSGQARQGSDEAAKIPESLPPTFPGEPADRSVGPACKKPPASDKSTGRETRNGVLDPLAAPPHRHSRTSAREASSAVGAVRVHPVETREAGVGRENGDDAESLAERGQSSPREGRNPRDEADAVVPTDVVMPTAVLVAEETTCGIKCNSRRWCVVLSLVAVCLVAILGAILAVSLKSPKEPKNEPEASSKAVCDANPCKNGGFCVVATDGFTCTCPTGYDGQMCENNRKDCPDTNPCQHGGRCIDGLEAYSCDCPAGYKGPICEDLGNLAIMWAGVIDNGEGDDPPTGPLGSLRYKLYESNEAVPKHGFDISSYGGDGPRLEGDTRSNSEYYWSDGGQRPYDPPREVHKWRSENDGKILFIYESDTDCLWGVCVQRDADPLFSALVKYRDLVNGTRVYASPFPAHNLAIQNAQKVAEYHDWISREDVVAAMDRIWDSGDLERGRLPKMFVRLATV